MKLEKELRKLNNTIATARRHLGSSLKSVLYCNNNRGSMQYYTVEDGRKKYLSKRKPQELKKIAQNLYYEKLLETATKQKKVLAEFIENYNSAACEDVYTNLPDDLKRFVSPYIKTDDMFAEEWASEEYETKGIKEGAVFYTTENGEKVRSKSELTIANKLFYKGIKYRYEEVHYMKGYGYMYPDFTILNKRTREEILWEHFGLMDNPEYVMTMLKKLQTYANNGIFPGKSLIITFEAGTSPLDVSKIYSLIEEYLY